MPKKKKKKVTIRSDNYLVMQGRKPAVHKSYSEKREQNKLRKSLEEYS